MNKFKDKLNKILEQGFNIALSSEIKPPPIYDTSNLNEETPKNKEEPSVANFMGDLSELIFPLCVTDFFVTNQTSSEDIFNAIEHINLTKEKTFVLFDSEISETSSLFLSKNEDFKNRLLANRKEKEAALNKPKKDIKTYSDNKSEELFNKLGIDSQVTSIKEKILKHFIGFKDIEDTSKYTLDGEEEANGYRIIYLAHLYRSKQHAYEGQKFIDAKRWYIERSLGIANELDATELAFADTTIIKQGRGGVSVALRFIIVPHGTIKENVDHRPTAFKIEDSGDSLRVVLSLEYKEELLDEVIKVISDPQNEKFQEISNMIEVYLENLSYVPEIEEARSYLESLTSNGEIDYIDLNINAMGKLGSIKGELAGKIKKDAHLKVIEFNTMSRQGVKDTKVYNFSLKASDRKDVGTLGFTDNWKEELEWIFNICGLDFKKLNWDKFAKVGNSDAIMENMKKYLISIEKTENEKLVKFMFTMLDMFAHGQEDSTIIAIAQSRKDIKIFSTLISEYIRSRKIFVSVLDLNVEANVETYYRRIAKRTGQTKRGRRPSQDIKQFLLQLTDESDNSYGVFKFAESQSRRGGSKLEEERGRKLEKIIFSPYKIYIDDELDELCKTLSSDLKDVKRRKILSINRIFRRLFLMDKLIQHNIESPKLLGQYKEIIESFQSILISYQKESYFNIKEIDYKLIEDIKTKEAFNLSEHYSGNYQCLNEFILQSKPLKSEDEPKLTLFYGTVIVYAVQKSRSLLKQLQDVSYQSPTQSP